MITKCGGRGVVRMPYVVLLVWDWQHWQLLPGLVTSGVPISSARAQAATQEIQEARNHQFLSVSSVENEASARLATQQEKK